MFYISSFYFILVIKYRPGLEIRRAVARQRAPRCCLSFRSSQASETASINRSACRFVFSDNGDSPRARFSIPATSPACQERVDIMERRQELAPFVRDCLVREFV